MRNLVIDLGNTNKKLAIFEAGQLQCVEQFQDFNLKMLKDFLKQFPAIDNCILASVVQHPAGLSSFLKVSCTNFIELDENSRLPVQILYRTRNTLGRDRIAGAVAGSALFPGHDVLVVNTGTCITYDFINSRKEYLGGAISPGLQMRFNALHTFTDKLPLIPFKNSRILTGRTTRDSILSGVLTGSTAEIEGFVSRYQEKYPNLKVVLSGGDHKYFDKRLKISIFALPNIVIHGLHQILEFNVVKAP
jgi:type III pantothenate kinase